MSIAIIVPVWNKAATTARFLQQAWPWVKKYEAQLIVVDNGSRDNTPKLLEHWSSKYGALLHVIRNSTNRGFGPANNQGVAAADAELLILMNNDVEIKGDFIGPTLKHLEVCPRTVVCRQLVDWNSGWNVFDDGKTIVAYAAGWFLGMSHFIWSLIGGFDEQFVPCDYEDVDFSMVASSLNVYLVQLKLPIHHRSGVTTHQLGNREKITQEHRKLFMEKWNLKA